VLAALKRLGGTESWVPHSKLAHQVWRFAPPAALRECMEALTDAEKVVRERRPAGGWAYRVVVEESPRGRTLRAVES
jgi:hypothetical protein